MGRLMALGSRIRTGRLVITCAGVAAVCALLAATVAGPTAIEARQTARKKLLLLTHNTFYNHAGLEAIEANVPRWGKDGNFEVTSLQGYRQTLACTIQQPCDASAVDLSIVTRAYLRQFDAIMFSVNGELPFSDNAKQALLDFVYKDGKGMVFIHQSMVTNYTWKPWGELLGAYMSGGPLFDSMNQTKRPMTLKIENSTHPATRHLPQGWTLHDEFYQFAKKVWDPATPTENLGPTKHPVPMAFSRDKVHVLISFESEKTDFTGTPKGWEKGGDYPQAWYQNFGQGRTFYTSLGHRADLWTSDPTFKAHIVGALRWALRLEQ